MKLNRDYPNLSFRVQWELKKDEWLLMGQAIAYLKAINNTPIMPPYYRQLMNVALIKGAQSTTAIEGNTLTDDEIEKLMEGRKLPESLEYQGIEINNILAAFDSILYETVYENKEQLITPSLLLKFHEMVGKDLGEHFGAIPGRFRNSDVVVGNYRCPDYRDVPFLIESYCRFLQETFRYQDGKQKFSDIFIEAIVAHVYLEWIHPFGDGNGRTGRLLEFYVLSRGGNPDITLHILSNHYNLTRPEYYRQLDKASKTGDLTEFIRYALVGYRDGLRQTLEKIQESQLKMTWQKYVYDQFGTVDIGAHKDVFKRRRAFALEMPIDKKFTFVEIPDLNITLAKLYSNIHERTIMRDIDELIELKILIKEGNEYFANVSALNRMIAKRKGLPIIL
jgi:Fic family protein